MQIEIKHCNNIEGAIIELTEGKLNIKFGPNGTGKSTIAKAIQFGALNDKDSLMELMPFSYREHNPNKNNPTVTGIENISTIMCFNESYVSQFTFQPEELVSNSFDIFIRTDVYKATEIEIDNLIRETKSLFLNNPDLEALISNLKELTGAFKVTAAGQLSKTTTGAKGLASGNKLEHIPEALESFRPFVQSQNGVGWIEWQTKGHKEFSELSENCPFCTADTAEKKEKIKKVGEIYDKSVIKNLVGIINIIEKLGDYFSEEAKENLETITKLKDGMEKEHETFIVDIKAQIDNLIGRLENLRSISGFHFKDGEKVVEKLPAYKLNLQFFDKLDSERTRGAIGVINDSIDALIVQAGKLQGEINKQRKEMKNLIEKHQKNINEFLAYAGYRYKVEIAGEDEKYQLKLKHADHNQYLNGGNQHLSFGERNAFAIVLFMYECLAKKPDLIVLDDPISSFDKNKKFAILEMLFRRDSVSCLKGKTVLMLTHDVEPIIDTLKSVKKQFHNQVSASYLRLSNGCISEKKIEDQDLKTFSQICKGVIVSHCDQAVKLIYLRRHYEILDDKGDSYQVLSNLLHLRARPIDTREPMDVSGHHPEMAQNRFTDGVFEIQSHINGFDYQKFINILSDIPKLKLLYQACQNGYEKLQVFRLFGMQVVDNSVIQKFINETYHIENEFICQLDPTKFDLIPEYVIKECDKLLNAA